MLESYAIGVNFQMTSNATTMVDRLLLEMDRLSSASNKARERVQGMVSGFRDLRRAASDVESMTRALERMNRTSSGGRGGGTGGRGGSAMDALHAQARYDNRLVDAQLATERRRAEHEDRLFEQRQRTIRRQAEYEDRLFTQQQRQAERTAQQRFTSDFALASRENSDRNMQRRAAERRSTDRSHAWVQAGMGGQMIGGAAIHGAEGALERGIEVEHLRTQILSDTRISAAQADAMVNRAYEATALAPGTKVSENLHALIDLKGLVGTPQDADKILPGFARLNALLKVIDKRRGGDGVFSAAKAMEIMGAMVEERTGADGETVHQIAPELLQKRLDLMGRVSVATNGRVSPQDYLGFAKQARVAGMTLTDEFIYEKLPAIMMAMGGPRAGTALMSMAQVFEGGKLTQQSMDALMAIGLAGPGGVSRVKDPRTGKMRNRVNSSAIYDLDVMRHDPEKWVGAAEKRMDAAGIHGSENQIMALMKASQRSTIAGMLADILKARPVILKEQETMRATRPDMAAYFAANDPAAKMQQLQASFDKLLTTFGGAATGDAIRLMDAATAGLNGLGEWGKNHPTMARLLVDTALGLGAVGTALGALSTAIFLFGPALKLLGIAGGSTAAGGAAGGAGLLGGLTLGGAAAVGSAAAVVGGAVVLGSAYQTPDTEAAQEKLARERRRDPMLMPSDGFGVDGRPNQPVVLNITLENTTKLDGATIALSVTERIARMLMGPNGGTTSFDPKAGLHGGVGALP